jgi:hypothetical protein
MAARMRMRASVADVCARRGRGAEFLLDSAPLVAVVRSGA